MQRTHAVKALMDNCAKAMSLLLIDWEEVDVIFNEAPIDVSTKTLLWAQNSTKRSGPKLMEATIRMVDAVFCSLLTAQTPSAAKRAPAWTIEDDPLSRRRLLLMINLRNFKQLVNRVAASSSSSSPPSSSME
mmetsp:Transcript_2089/g.4623  ORF Transcript_2089/g.4623 Transcript_2089/m.4623 type:complete len:132 (+) Transcript_2089:217-612(+)